MNTSGFIAVWHAGRWPIRCILSIERVELWISSLSHKGDLYVEGLWNQEQCKIKWKLSIPGIMPGAMSTICHMLNLQIYLWADVWKLVKFYSNYHPQNSEWSKCSQHSTSDACSSQLCLCITVRTNSVLACDVWGSKPFWLINLSPSCHYLIVSENQEIQSNIQSQVLWICHI